MTCAVERPDLGITRKLCYPAVAGVCSDILPTNGKLVSASGRFTLFMQTDANLILYDAAKGAGNYTPTAVLWATSTWTTSANTNSAKLESDGRLKVYRNGAIVYTSNPSPLPATGDPVTLVVQGDGNVVLFQCGMPYWATNTWAPGAGPA